MNKHLITVDFWNTLVDATDHGNKRKRARSLAIKTFAGRKGLRLDDTKISDAQSEVSKKFDNVWFGQQRTLTSIELAKETTGNLGLLCEPSEMEDLAREFELSLFAGPPPPAPGIKEALTHLSKYYTLAIVSDTMYSPGNIIKRHLESLGLLPFFDAFSFSDDTGVSKPHPKAYQHVVNFVGALPSQSWHIGDLEKTDIAGAKSVGMKAILYTGLSDKDKAQTTADFISRKWEYIADYLVSER